MASVVTSVKPNAAAWLSMATASSMALRRAVNDSFKGRVMRMAAVFWASARPKASDDSAASSRVASERSAPALASAATISLSQRLRRAGSLPAISTRRLRATIARSTGRG